MSTDIITNVVFIVLAIGATVASHWIPEITPTEIGIIWGFTSYHGIATVAQNKLLSSTQQLTQAQDNTTNVQPQVVVRPTQPTGKAG